MSLILTRLIKVDGSYPRAINNSVTSQAHLYDSSIRLTENTWIKARAFTPSQSRRVAQWSALHEGFFTLGSITDSLRITELMYHPLGEENTEDIELKNTGCQTIALLDITFTQGIRFQFDSMQLAPGAMVILAKDPALFATTYTQLPVGTPVVSPYEGQLSNSGERLLLNDPTGTVIHDVTYRDDWYPSTDGEGPSLDVRLPLPIDQEAWMPSTQDGGSPGQEGLMGTSRNCFCDGNERNLFWQGERVK